jgi:hypothetical protein
MNRLLFSGLIILFIVGCTGTRVGGHKSPSEGIDLVARDYFEGSYAVKTNESDTYSIVYKNYKKLTELLPDVHFIVVKHATNEVIFEDKLKAGNVNWYSDSELVAIARNLPVKTADDPNRLTYYFNVHTKRKTIED